MMFPASDSLCLRRLSRAAELFIAKCNLLYYSLFVICHGLQFTGVFHPPAKIKVDALRVSLKNYGHLVKPSFVNFHCRFVYLSILLLAIEAAYLSCLSLLVSVSVSVYLPLLFLFEAF